MKTPPLSHESKDPAAPAARVNELEQKLRQSEAPRRRLEEQLAEQQAAFAGQIALFGDLSQHTPGLLYQLRSNRDGTNARFTYLSESCREYLGLAPAAVIADPRQFLTAIHPYDRDAAIKSWERASAELAPFVAEFRIVQPDAEPRWVEVISRPRLYENGEMSYTGMIIDISRRKQAEATLRDQHQLLEDIAERIPGLLFQTRGRRDGTTFEVPFISGRVEEFTGWTADEIIRNPVRLLEAIHPDDRERYFAAAEECSNTLAPFSIELRLVSRSGEVRWVAIKSRGRELGEEEGSYNGVALDITDRKLAEDELQQSYHDLESRVQERTAELERERRTLAAILTQLPVGVYVTEAPSGRPVIWNQQLLQITGGRPEELEGIHDMVLKYPMKRYGTGEPYPVDEMPLVRAMRGEKHAIDDIVFQRPDGTTVPLYVTGAPVYDADGQLRLAVVTLQDIRQRKKAQEALHQEQEFLRNLIRAHETDRQLMAYEIHDGLVQYIAGALLQLESIDRSAIGENVGKPLTEASNHLRLAIADARRVLSGLRPPILDEQGIVMAINYLIAENCRPHGIDVEFQSQVEFDRLEPLLEGTIFRIVQESLTNIRRHSQAKRAKVVLLQENQRIKLVIRDWGIGFDPDKTPPNRFGLQGIRRRASLLGGHAEIRSAPGEGTTILVDLPCQEIE